MKKSSGTPGTRNSTISCVHHHTASPHHHKTRARHQRVAKFFTQATIQTGRTKLSSTIMFTRHEIFKHFVQSGSDSDLSSDEDDLDYQNFGGTSSSSHHRTKALSIVLHLVDCSFVPNSSSLTRLEPIDSTPQERIVPLCLGTGSQTFRWLALTARERLHQLYHREGLVRQRESVLGRMGSFLPTSIVSEDPETDGEFLEPDKILNTVLQNGDHLWLSFDQAGGVSTTSWERKAFFRNKTMATREQKVVEKVKLEQKSRPRLRSEHPSVFYSRKLEADSHDYYDTKELLDRAFRSDWSKWKTKPRFFKQVDAKVKAHLYQHHTQLRALFRFFASSGAGDPFTMSMNEFVTLTRECQIPQYSLGVLWKVSNFNPENPKASDHVLERYEFLEIMMRLASELYIDGPRVQGHKNMHAAGGGGENGVPAEDGVAEMAAAAAVDATDAGNQGGAKEGSEQKKSSEHKEEGDVQLEQDDGEEEEEEEKEKMMMKEMPKTMGEAISKLMNDHIHKYCWKDVKHAAVMYADPDAFRRERLYYEEVNKIFLKHSDDLLVLYEFYAQKSALRLREFNSSLKLLCYKEFEDILHASGVISAGDPAVTGDVLSTMDCRRSFVFAQMLCANFVDRSRKERSHNSENRATFVEFCEALARVADLGACKRSATPDQLLPTLSLSLATFLEKIMKGMSSKFWKTHRHKGHYKNTVTKKFGRVANGPEVGRYELDKSPQAVASRLKLRKFAATQLSQYMLLPPIETEKVVEEEIDADESKRRRKK